MIDLITVYMYLDPQNDDLKTSDQIWFNEYTLFIVNWDVQMLNWDVKFIILSLYIYLDERKKSFISITHINTCNTSINSKI